MEEIIVSNRIRNMAENLAYSSDYHPYKVGAVIVRGRRIIAGGFNKNKTHTIIRNKLDRFSLTDKLHAEMTAVLKAKTDLTGTKIYIFRACPEHISKMGLARPCRLCMRLIKNSGIKEIFYTTGNLSQPWIKERV